MKKQFIIRLDDISWDMNYENFSAVRDILINNKIIPLIGVIPENGDLKLKRKVGSKKIRKKEFWSEIRGLHIDYKWDIALHGHNHVYVTKDGGLLQKNNQSEFSGLPYKEQFSKIEKGLEILKSEGLNPIAFMAPSHSFDKITIQALKDNDLKCVTDGYSLFPYFYKDILFVPQLRSYPKPRGIGIDTICYHTNSMQEKDIDRFRQFVLDCKERIISFNKVVAESVNSYPFYWRLLNPVSMIAIKAKIELRNLKQR